MYTNCCWMSVFIFTTCWKILRQMFIYATRSIIFSSHRMLWQGNLTLITFIIVVVITLTIFLLNRQDGLPWCGPATRVGPTLQTFFSKEMPTLTSRVRLVQCGSFITRTSSDLPTCTCKMKLKANVKVVAFNIQHSTFDIQHSTAPHVLSHVGCRKRTHGRGLQFVEARG